MVSSLMHDWHDKCLTVPIFQSASLHATKSKQLSADHCHRPDFDLLYYRRPMSLAGDGPLMVDDINAQTWWCPESSVLCQLCSDVWLWLPSLAHVWQVQMYDGHHHTTCSPELIRQDDILTAYICQKLTTTEHCAFEVPVRSQRGIGVD